MAVSGQDARRALVVNTGVTATVTGLTLRDGYGFDMAGGVLNNGHLTLDHVVVADNTVTTGAIEFWKGGGVFHTDGAMTISSSTVTGNTAPGGTAGGLFLGSFGAPNGSASLQGSIVSGNSGDECIVFYGGPFAMESLGANVLGDATCGAAASTDVVVDDALLGPLADNGGPTLTHALLPGSPALDAGDASGPDTDQRGVARPQGAGPDAGSFELEVA